MSFIDTILTDDEQEDAEGDTSIQILSGSKRQSTVCQTASCFPNKRRNSHFGCVVGV